MFRLDAIRYRAQVRRGAKVLSRVFGEDWYERINLTRLDISCANQCCVGQLAMPAWKAASFPEVRWYFIPSTDVGASSFAFGIKMMMVIDPEFRDELPRLGVGHFGFVGGVKTRYWKEYIFKKRAAKQAKQEKVAELAEVS